MLDLDVTACPQCGGDLAAEPGKVYCSETCRKRAEHVRRYYANHEDNKRKARERYYANHEDNKRKAREKAARRSGRDPSARRQRRTLADLQCKDCGTRDCMDWWVGRYAWKPDGPLPNCSARCQRCYNAVVAMRYRRRRGLPVEGYAPGGVGRGGNAVPWKVRRRWARANLLVATRACLDCGTVFHPAAEGRQSSKRCTYCTDALSERNKGVSIARRKAAERNGDDGINWRTVGERDGWVCHLCGGRVLKVSAVKQPRGATVDHIIPVSDGGQHVWVNVALAHRRCNLSRGARGPAQMRLVGC